MRHMTRTDALAARSRALGVPTAIAGSIALVLTSAPASAAEPAATTESGFAKSSPTAAPRPVLVQGTAVPAAYTVKRGDTIWGIATRHGLRPADVLALNGLKASSIIRPGQVLRLVGTTAKPKAAPAKSGKTAKAPAKSGKTAKTHVVRPGDTVWAIASANGLSVAKVLAANSLSSSSIIYPGQKLAIPGKAAASAPATSATKTPASRPASVSGKTHVVKAGDSVFAIAKKHGVSTKAVLSANGLNTASIIYPGQKLTIPSKGVTLSVPLNDKQIENTKLIISVGRSLGVPERGIAIALGTAMVESGLRNLDYGDRDSVGLFQQRPSQGWGTAAQAQDRVRATKAFFGGPSDPNGTRTRGLLDIPGWKKMSFAQAAQAVQISAFPDRYAKWEKPAAEWLAAFG